MAETQTLYEPSISDPEAITIELGRPLDASGPGSLETLVALVDPVEGKPVSWDGPDDPNNPQNWSASKKWLVMFAIGVITVNVCVPFACHP